MLSAAGAFVSIDLITAHIATISSCIIVVSIDVIRGPPGGPVASVRSAWGFDPGRHRTGV